ncbi:MAG: hypothetical protein AAFX81_10490 [Pseudomonadota bacterium]
MAERYRRWALAAALIGSLAGCQTYLEQKADASAGGPQRRVDDANQRLALAQDETYSLQTTLEDDQAYLGHLQANLDDAQRNLNAQRARLASARNQNRITAAEERAAEQRLASATADVESAVLEIQSKEALGNAGAADAKRRELTQLQQKIEAINEEIALMTR